MGSRNGFSNGFILWAVEMVSQMVLFYVQAYGQ